MTQTLGRGFYERDPADVARGLLGKTLVRTLGSERFEGVIVETEAYYGEGTPPAGLSRGSRATTR